MTDNQNLKSFEVVNAISGHSFGIYRAENASAAIEACCRDAGYSHPLGGWIKASADEMGAVEQQNQE